MAAVPVIRRAARPVPVVSEKLEHQIEQLHRFSDFRFRHWSDRTPPLGNAKHITDRGDLHRLLTAVE